MRNLFGLFGGNDRRPASRSRAYPQMTPSPRRYERPEVGRADYQRAAVARPEYRQERRRSQPQEVNWRRRGILALSGLGTVAVLVGAIWLYRSPVLRVRVIDVNP